MQDFEYTNRKGVAYYLHIEPHTICVLNKTCRFCPACELAIAKQVEIEPMLGAMAEQQRGAIEQGDYLVIGTLDRGDWRAGKKDPWSPAQAVERAWLFRDHWDFKVTRGWQLADDRPPE